MEDAHVQVETPDEKSAVETGASENALKIFCRLRPIKTGRDAKTANEESLKDAIERKDDTVLTLRRENSLLVQQYIFEYVFGKNDPQGVVFEIAAAPLVDSLLAGRDGLIFAYGATGSGKSYTVAGEPDKPGIVPQTVDFLFDALGPHANDEYIIEPDSRNNFAAHNRFSVDKQPTALDIGLQLGAADRKR